jgi:glucose/arabinose dehydrogenase
VTDDTASVETIAEDLVVPWEVVRLPEGDLLVTERPGRLRRIGGNQKVYEIAGVQHVGEGGLMGLALHPDHGTNKFVYLYLTSREGGGLINRVERYVLDNDALSDKTVILNNIPGASNHDGGRIAFGPDRKLYITTGDAGREELAQDKNSLAGKILRLNDDGSVPSDNPFGNAVYSYGHRNPQGIAWDGEGRLWSSEHGPSGTGSGFDELNRIVRGGNYGWPTIQGDESADGMIRPVAHSGAEETWAPAGLAYHDGSLFFTGLRGESLYEAEIKSEDSVVLKAHFRGVYGRLRAVTTIEDALYVTTSNQDGRGNIKPGDDRIIKLSTGLFN